MSSEQRGLDPSLLAWCARDDHAVAGWEPEPAVEALHCHPDLVARVAAVCRPVAGTARVFVAGCPVIHHRNGRPIAVASGTRWFAARSDRPVGALAPAAPCGVPGPDWLELDPWSADLAFAKSTDLLRAHVQRAYDLAGTYD